MFKYMYILAAVQPALEMVKISESTMLILAKTSSSCVKHFQQHVFSPLFLSEVLRFVTLLLYSNSEIVQCRADTVLKATHQFIIIVGILFVRIIEIVSSPRPKHQPRLILETLQTSLFI